MEPSLLIPAIIAFSLLIVGLLITVREFYTEKNIGQAPYDHKVRVAEPSPKQVASAVKRTQSGEPTTGSPG